MKPRRLLWGTIQLSVTLAWSLVPFLCQAEPLRLDSSARPSEWTVWHGPKKLLTYAFDPAKFKPYVKELCTVAGQNVLRDAPSDHLHHHALMYGIRINGVNFWEETPGNGVQKVVQFPPPEVSVDAAGRPQVRIAQVLHWLKPEDAFLPDSAAVAFVVEHRTLAVTVNETESEVALEWTSQFEVGRKTNVVTLSGANYHGLGMRFLRELDPLATHSLAGRVLDLSQNRQEVAQAPWAAVQFDLSGHPTTLALAGHPDNPRGDTTFFTMKTPFAYLSATQGLEKDTLIYRAGDTFRLRYLLLLYPDLRSAESLNRRTQQWRERH